MLATRRSSASWPGSLLPSASRTSSSPRHAIFSADQPTRTPSGAAAGLTLLVDFYSYDYGDRKLTGLDPDAPVLSCRPIGAVPVPDAVPEVAWRAGLDLNPLDPSDPADVEWLSCLLWPGEEGRAERLAAAAAVWLANEAPGVVPDAPAPPDGRPGFVLVKDGTELLARSDAHGGWLEWLT
ncbi:MAG: DUF2332 family protein [Acidimicrobiales bacterium]